MGGSEEKSESEKTERKDDKKYEEVLKSHNQRAIFSEEDEIDIFELWNIIWKRRKIIFALSFVITSITLIISFFMTPIYKSTAEIVPLSSKRSFAIPVPSEALQLLGISGLGGGGAENIIKAVLNSRELAKRVIQQTGIEKYLYGKLWDEKKNRIKENIPPEKIPSIDELAELFIKDYLEITEDKKTGAIEISVIFPKEPTLASFVANKYLEELQKILNEKSYTLAKKNRMFLEERIKIAKAELERAESEFREFQEKYNVVAIDRQMEEGLRLYAELVGTLSEREMKLEVLKKLTTPDNPEVLSLQYEINELRKKIKELESGQNRGAIKGYMVDTNKRLLIPLESVPDVALEYIRRRRNLEIQNEIYKVLLTALEQAKIDEAKEDISFEVVDTAYPPRYRYKPKRKLMVAVAFVSSMMLGVFLAFFLEAVQKRKEKEEESEREKNINI